MTGSKSIRGGRTASVCCSFAMRDGSAFRVERASRVLTRLALSRQTGLRHKVSLQSVSPSLHYVSHDSGLHESDLPQPGLHFAGLHDSDLHQTGSRTPVTGKIDEQTWKKLDP